MQKQHNIELFSALLAGNPAVVDALVHAADFELDQFRAFTDVHQLSGFLYLHIKGSPLEGLFPAEYLECLGERGTQQRQRCDDILQEAAHIYDTFKAADQPVLFLKGPFVAQQFYGNVHQRSYIDIDILIPRDDLLAADRLLREMGFSRLSLVLVSNKTMTRFTHTYDYHKRIARPDTPVHRRYLPLDLHWKLRSHFSFRLDYESIWKQQEVCRLQGRSFPVLSAEYALVLNLLGIFFDIELGTIRLKNFLDLYMMLEALDSSMDWAAFFKRRASENISEIALNVIDLHLDVLDCRSRYPGVASFIEKNRRLIRLTDSPDKYRLLDRSRVTLKNRRWAHARYHAPVLQSYLWTMMSLPFRIAAHDRVFQKFMGRLN
jgi:Uncharacterised nucleotidyltransferase